MSDQASRQLVIWVARIEESKRELAMVRNEMNDAANLQENQNPVLAIRIDQMNDALMSLFSASLSDEEIGRIQGHGERDKAQLDHTWLTLVAQAAEELSEVRDQMNRKAAAQDEPDIVLATRIDLLSDALLSLQGVAEPDDELRASVSA